MAASFLIRVVWRKLVVGTELSLPAATRLQLIQNHGGGPAIVRGVCARLVKANRQVFVQAIRLAGSGFTHRFALPITRS